MTNHAAHAQKSANPIPVITSALRNFGCSMASHVIPEMMAMANRMYMASEYMSMEGSGP